METQNYQTQVTNEGARSAFPGYCSESELLDRLSAAGYPLKKATLANWRAGRRGPPFTKFGRLVLYPEAELRAWLHAKTIGAERRSRRSAA
ncbi:MAG: hypothetical protein ING19_01420 [Azospirillum sp.]|nr:hypothetical protein [Azospirillum sp.]MCA3264701.1 hypothetical protein [Azospirillum sp.]